MPTNRKRVTRGRHAALTGRQIEHLLWGWCLSCGREGNPFGPFDNDGDRRKAWFENRAYILSLEGMERVPGVFGNTPFKKGATPRAMQDYEGSNQADSL